MTGVTVFLSSYKYPVFQDIGNIGGPLSSSEAGEVIGVLNSAFIKISNENMHVSTGLSYSIPINHAKEPMESIKKITNE